MEIELTKSVLPFYESKPQLNKEIRELFGNPPLVVLANIMNNLRLFNVYKRCDCQKFLSILDALDKLDDNHVLIFISELQVYGLFTHDGYLDFTKKLHEMLDEDNVSSNVYQVILNEGNQKIVFMCSDADRVAAATVDKMAKHVKEFFGTTVNVVENGEKVEITINKIIAGKDRHEQFDELFNYVHKRDPELAGKISLLRTYREREYKYTMPKLQPATTMEELINILKTAHNVTINGPVIINNGGNNTQILKAAVDKKSIARDWIIANEPADGEKTTDYYIRYTNSVNKPLPSNQFGPLAKQTIGHNPVRGTDGSRHW